MIPGAFAELCRDIATAGKDVTLPELMAHIAAEHNNASWVATVADLKTVIEEMTGVNIAVRIV